jgi:hypothetical protein
MEGQWGSERVGVLCVPTWCYCAVQHGAVCQKYIDPLIDLQVNKQEVAARFARTPLANQAARRKSLWRIISTLQKTR